MHSSAFYIERLSQVADIAHRGRLHAQARMRWLDSELAKCPFIAGDHYTIADITAQCALILGKNTGTPIPNDSQHLARWFSDVSKRPTARGGSELIPLVESSSRDLRFGHSVEDRTRSGFDADL